MAAHRRLRPLSLRVGALLGALGAVVAFGLWWTGRTDGRAHIIVPPIAGDGFLLKSAGGQIALIDGGADGPAVATWLGKELPLGRQQLDLLILTRADRTTLPGQLAVARRYHILQALLARPQKAEPQWDELVRLLQAAGTPMRIAHLGDRAQLPGTTPETTATFNVLAAMDGWIALDLRLGEQRVLLLQSIAGKLLTLQLDGQVAVLVYPWRRIPHDPALATVVPHTIVFGDQPGIDPQLTLADRQIGSATLLHETLDGRIELQFGPDGLHITTAKTHTD